MGIIIILNNNQVMVIIVVLYNFHIYNHHVYIKRIGTLLIDYIVKLRRSSLHTLQDQYIQDSINF
eukprot:UN08921